MNLARLLAERGKKGGKLANALAYQAMLDNAPVGSVGAPSGVMPNPSQASGHDPVQGLLDASTMAPVIGDVMGPIADIRRFQQNPETRTIGNALMFGAGLLPAIPSLAFMMGRGGNAARRVTPFSKEAGIIGYHGSPHKFDAFDMSKIGTGEGAQAYGHGLYFAESPEVAKGYRDALAGLSYKGRPLSEIPGDEGSIAMQLASDMSSGKSFDEAKAGLLSYLKDNDSQELYAIAKEMKPNDISRAGSLYTVDIPDEHIDKMLDWDKPLSEQPENVRRALMEGIPPSQPADGFDLGGNARLRDNRSGSIDPSRPYPWLLESGDKQFGLSQKDVDRMFGTNSVLDSLTGEQLITRLAQAHGGQAKASEYLRSLGIPGIKYLDAGSRGAGNGTRNFVVFDDKIPKILKRE